MRGLDHVRTTNQHASKDARQASQQWEQETAIQPRLNTIIMVRSIQDRTIQQAYGGMMTPDRTQEGWVIIDTERRNDDPHVYDDCWHRGAYTIYSVRGTNIRVEQLPNDGIGATWDRLEETMRDNGLTGIVELMGHAAKGLGYRVIHTIYTQAELAAIQMAYSRCDYPYSD